MNTAGLKTRHYNKLRRKRGGREGQPLRLE